MNTDPNGPDHRSNRGYSRVHFITGATGLLTSEYVAEVLKQDANARLRLLVRADSAQNAAKRVDDLIAFLYPEPADYALARPRVLALWGDVTQPYLGMDERDWYQLTREVDIIVHASNLASRRATLEETRLVNVHGARQVIDLAHACGSRLERLVHVSTAYVSGTRTGQLEPDELHIKAPVCDWFQRTQREAESLMRKIWSRIPVTIVRPSIVVGNAENGRAIDFSTFYFPLQLLYQGARLAFPVSPRGQVDLVPSDWAARALYALQKHPETSGRCFHLSAGDRAQNNRQLRDHVNAAMTACGEPRRPYSLAPQFLYRRLLLSRFRKSVENGDQLAEKLDRYRGYMQFQRCFDNHATLEITEAEGITQPDIADYLPRLIRFAIDNHWRHQKAITAPEDPDACSVPA